MTLAGSGWYSAYREEHWLALVHLGMQLLILGVIVYNLILHWQIKRLQAERHKYVTEAIDAIIKHQEFLDSRITMLEGT